MEKYLKQIRAQKSQLEDEITDRTKLFNDRSVTYQTSRKGAEFETKTIHLQEYLTELKTFLENIESIGYE